MVSYSHKRLRDRAIEYDYYSDHQYCQYCYHFTLPHIINDHYYLTNLKRESAMCDAIFLSMIHSTLCEISPTVFPPHQAYLISQTGLELSFLVLLVCVWSARSMKHIFKLLFILQANQHPVDHFLCLVSLFFSERLSLFKTCGAQEWQ